MTRIKPELDDEIAYIGHIDSAERQALLSNAKAVIIPSIFEEPFGMVAIEAMACGTPVVALDSGALPEIITPGKSGFVAKKVFSLDGKLNEKATAANLLQALNKLDSIDRNYCRQEFENRFTLNRMCAEHLAIYKKLSV